MKDLRRPAKEAWQGSEDSLQQACAEWMKKALQRYGFEQELFWHVPSEGIRKPQYRAKLKLMGFRAGIPDGCLALPSMEYHGAYCELKRAGGTPSADQKQMLAALARRGYFVCLINDFDTFVTVFTYYLEQAIP